MSPINELKTTASIRCINYLCFTANKPIYESRNCKIIKKFGEFVKRAIVERTLKQYDEQAHRCREVFSKKHEDYGNAWYILRPSSLTDQMYIKAKRIRSIEEQGTQKIEEGIENEYIGLVNYGLMALLQMKYASEELAEMDAEELLAEYDRLLAEVKDLMKQKNFDYGEAWRDMRVSSLTDLILMKLLRIRQIEHNEGKTIISEGLDANYMDIINYSIFALIQIKEKINQ